MKSVPVFKDYCHWCQSLADGFSCLSNSTQDYHTGYHFTTSVHLGRFFCMEPFKESVLCLLSAKQYSGIEKYSGKAEHRVTAIVELIFAW